MPPINTELFIWLAAAVVAFFGSVLSGVAGFGGAMVFLPVLAALYGPRAAVPILTVSVFFGNASRLIFFWRGLRLEVGGRFLAGAIPAAILGSLIYVELPAHWIRQMIGGFLILSVAYQRLIRPWVIQNSAWFFPIGAASGFLSAIVGGIGPLMAPFLLSFGLAKETFIATDAFCGVGMHLTKAIAYNRLGVLPTQELAIGSGFGLVMAAGSYAAKKILARMSREKFLLLVETLLILIGLGMLLG